MNKVIRTIEISAEADAVVERLAKDMARTPSEVLEAAVQQLASDLDDIAIDLERWAEFERTGVSLSEEEFRDSIEMMKQRATGKS